MEDASLDEFLASEAADGATDASAAAGPGSTYAFSPGGAECTACGATTTRRWRQDGDLVCPDCKRWGE